MHEKRGISFHYSVPEVSTRPDRWLLTASGTVIIDELDKRRAKRMTEQVLAVLQLHEEFGEFE
ncbi:hypothetical protein ccbrp13_09710 [Ktedonobacteria bacterium brp13]|nr:hypothetical protein ccbrp13_09710 [Ktedonobacteria bacterium brp13]